MEVLNEVGGWLFLEFLGWVLIVVEEWGIDEVMISLFYCWIYVLVIVIVVLFDY